MTDIGVLPTGGMGQGCPALPPGDFADAGSWQREFARWVEVQPTDVPGDREALAAQPWIAFRPPAADRAGACAPAQAASDLPPRLHEPPSNARPAVRMHLQDGQGQVHLWIGLDGEASAVMAAAAAAVPGLRRVLVQEGHGLARLVCNGREIYPQAGLPLAASRRP